MSETLVKVENVSKKFCRDLKRSLWYGMRDLGSELLCRSLNSHVQLRKEEFWAVKDVSFELKRGDCLGLIGRNGAGKTTLLRILNGLIKPDQGRVEMRGRIGALIALGTGFNPILSGRENIYVNAAVLGLRKSEVDSKIEEIIEFSDLRDSIDAPVQSYSSGMQVRLGFAISTALEPDILLLDEVLAVGDALFRNKCYQRVISLKKHAAVIFVSHNMEQLARISDRVLVLSQGKRHYIGDVGDGIKSYENLNQANENSVNSFLSLSFPIKEFGFSCTSYKILSGDKILFRLFFHSISPIDEFILRLWLYNEAGQYSAECNLFSNAYNIKIEKGPNNWELFIPQLSLRHGVYKIGLFIIDHQGEIIVWSYKQQSISVLGNHSGAVADYQLTVEKWQNTGFSQNYFFECIQNDMP